MTERCGMPDLLDMAVCRPLRFLALCVGLLVVGVLGWRAADERDIEVEA